MADVALIVGSTGQLGIALRRATPPRWSVVAPSRTELDLADAASIRRAVADLRPRLIVNAGGYTDVERAEEEPDVAMAVNGVGAATLAELAHAAGARLITISTDYVFDGCARVPYAPDAQPNPLNAYGRSKLEGERATMAHAPDALILRTSWLYGPTGRNFARTMLHRMRGTEAVRVVNDQTGAPTSTATLAAAIWQAADRRDVRGIQHLSDAGAATWYDFACAIADEARQVGLLGRAPVVEPIPSAAFPQRAKRPTYSVLETRDSWNAIGMSPPEWRVALAGVIHEIAQGAAQ